MPTHRKTHLASLCTPLLLFACGDDGRETATAVSDTLTSATLPPFTTTQTSDVPTGGEGSSSGSTAPATDATSTPTSGDTDTTQAGDTTVGVESASSSETSLGDTSTSAGDTSTSEGESSSTGEPPDLSCSDDLHSVIDEENNVVEECGPGLGCYAGACVPACQVAELQQGTAGCDFWAPTPPFYLNGQNTSYNGPCFAVFVANSWNSPATLSVARGGQQFDASQFARIPKTVGNSIVYEPIPPEGLPPDEVAILFLSHKPGAKHQLGFTLECPVTPAVLADTAVAVTGKGLAFHVTADVPVTTYDINPYGGATSFLPSASLLFPATSWGTSHMAIAPAPGGRPGFALVVAREDNTVIEVSPSASLPAGGGQPAAPAGVTTQYVLSAGESLQWAKAGLDTSGSIFNSDKPIGLWTGSTEIEVASQTLGPGGHDSAHQEIAPVSALGDEYVAAGVMTRLGNLGAESVPYRIVGAINGTVLTYDPAPPAGAPTMLAAGQVAQFATTSFFSVRSQDADHPFLFSQYMSGTSAGTRPGCGAPVAGIPCGLGDEEWVSLLSSKQFQRRYPFFTDPTYATTNLVIVRAKENGAFADVNVACLGAVSGWQPVGAAGTYEVAHVDLERGNVPLGMCGTSQHLAESTGPFGVVVWGTDRYASYGYPAGSSISKLNGIELIPQ